MKLIHISDLHLCLSYKRNNIKKTKKLIKHIAEQNAGHLIITGDISDNADENDYCILKKILQAFNLYSSEKTTIIPGNHDIFGGVQKAEDIISFPSKCNKTDYEARIKRFAEIFEELFRNTYFPFENEYFPFAKPLDGVVLIALNTVDKYSKLKNPTASNGKVGRKQLGGLIDALTAKSFSGYKKIVIAHHHFYKNCDEVKSSESIIWNSIEKFTMKLRGKKKLIKAFSENKVSCVLHGHSHDMREYERKGVLFLNAGGSIENYYGVPGRYFQIDTEDDRIIPVLRALREEEYKPEKKEPAEVKFV